MDGPDEPGHDDFGWRMKKTLRGKGKMHPAKDPQRSVWLQLGFPDAETHYLKAELVLRLDQTIKAHRLSQLAAAHRIGTTQPELSKILGGKFSEVSLERLMRFLAALGHRVEIKIGAVGKKGDITVSNARSRAA